MNSKWKQILQKAIYALSPSTVHVYFVQRLLYSFGITFLCMWYALSGLE